MEIKTDARCVGRSRKKWERHLRRRRSSDAPAIETHHRERTAVAEPHVVVIQFRTDRERHHPVAASRVSATLVFHDHLSFGVGNRAGRYCFAMERTRLRFVRTSFHRTASDTQEQQNDRCTHEHLFSLGRTLKEIRPIVNPY